MADIVTYNINCPQGAEIVKVGDDTVRIVKYIEESSDRELLELKRPFTTNSNYYELRVNPPKQKLLDYIMIISRTSANCYKMAYCSFKQSAFENGKNYDDVNAFVRQHTSPIK